MTSLRTRRLLADAALNDKTLGEIIESPELTRLALSRLGPLSKMRLWFRHVNRFGFYLKMCKSGLSDEDAGKYVEAKYPMSFWDHVYFQHKARTHLATADTERTIRMRSWDVDMGAWITENPEAAEEEWLAEARRLVLKYHLT